MPQDSRPNLNGEDGHLEEQKVEVSPEYIALKAKIAKWETTKREMISSMLKKTRGENR